MTPRCSLLGWDGSGVRSVVCVVAVGVLLRRGAESVPRERNQPNEPATTRRRCRMERRVGGRLYSPSLAFGVRLRVEHGIGDTSTLGHSHIADEPFGSSSGQRPRSQLRPRQGDMAVWILRTGSEGGKRVGPLAPSGLRIRLGGEECGEQGGAGGRLQVVGAVVVVDVGHRRVVVCAVVCCCCWCGGEQSAEQRRPTKRRRRRR